MAPSMDLVLMARWAGCGGVHGTWRGSDPTGEAGGLDGEACGWRHDTAT